MIASLHIILGGSEIKYSLYSAGLPVFHDLPCFAEPDQPGATNPASFGKLGETVGAPFTAAVASLERLLCGVAPCGVALAALGSRSWVVLD